MSDLAAEGNDDTRPEGDETVTVRIEWGHRLAADFPGREKYTDADEIRPCWDRQAHRPRTEPCENPTVNGFPQDHVWRQVTITPWRKEGRWPAKR